MKIFTKYLILSLLISINAVATTISNLVVREVHNFGATVYWTTDVPAISVLMHGTKSTGIPVVDADTVKRLQHSMEIRGINAGTRCYFKVRSIDAKKKSRTSAVKSFVSTGKPGNLIQPDAPRSLYATSIQPGGFQLTWDKVSGAKAYLIYGHDGLFVYTSSPTHFITGLRPGAKYINFSGTTASFYVQSIDSANNVSHASQRFQIWLPDTAILPLDTSGAMFSSRVNPTGSPVGGGFGYKRGVFEKSATYVVHDREALLSTLKKAKKGEVVYIYDFAEIDLSQDSNIVIPGGVTLASGRGRTSGALLYSNRRSPEAIMTSMFRTGGDSVRITGLRLRGPNPDVTDHDYETFGVANAIRSMHPGLEVDNCDLSSWDKWTVWLFISRNAYIHHNYIHHSMRAGYGYGVWCGGSGSEKNATARIEANLFEATRDCIASSGHLNSWEFRYNVILKKQLYANMDRHSQGNSGFGGKSITATHNLFFSTQRHMGFAAPADTSGRILVTKNWFRLDSLSVGGAGSTAYVSDTNNPQISIYGNWYSGTNRQLPIARMWTSQDSGYAPLVVGFDGSLSIDSSGAQIRRYSWKFGDETSDLQEVNTAYLSHTFEEPGIYTVTLVVFNEYGVPSDVIKKTIIVKPRSEKLVLSGWVKDSYIGTISGKYLKQVLLNDSVIWTDDVEGNEGWQHITMELPTVPKNLWSKISFRLYGKTDQPEPLKGIVEIMTWWDDFVIFGATLQNTSFDKPISGSAGPWNQTIYTPIGMGGVSTGVVSVENRSGENSFQVRIPYSGPTKAGFYGQIYQWFKY